MRERQQNTTTHPLAFFLALASDHVTGATGLTPTVTVSKDGGAFGSPSGAVAEIANGWYSLAGNATDRNTLGQFLLHATGTGADPSDSVFTVVAYDPFDAVRLGLTALPSSGTLAVKPAVTLAAADVTGNLPANVTQWLAAAVTSAVSGFPDVNVRAVRGTALVGTGNLPSDVVTIGGQGVSASGTITFPAATLASTVNITAASGVTVAGYAASQDPATLVLDVLASGHNTANSIGAKINSAASAGDPWSTDVVAGAYAGTQAGALMSGWSKYGVVAAVSDTGPTATSFKLGSGASTTDGAYVNQFFSFETGTLIGQRRQITGYTGATKTVTFSSGFTAAPSNADVGVIV